MNSQTYSEFQRKTFVKHENLEFTERWSFFTNLIRQGNLFDCQNRLKNMFLHQTFINLQKKLFTTSSRQNKKDLIVNLRAIDWTDATNDLKIYLKLL